MKTQLLALATLLLAGNLVAQTPPDVTFDLGNDGNLDYVVISSTDASLVAGELPASDPEITLEIGKRYSFNNAVYNDHPLEIVARGNAPFSDTVLLSNDRTGDVFDGTMESDPAIEWLDTGSQVTFTLTQGLADAMSAGVRGPGYRCRPHSGDMRGGFVIKGGSDTPTPTATVTATATATPTPTATATPDGPSSDASYVTETLNSTQWNQISITPLFRAPIFSENGGLTFEVPQGNLGDPSVFGIWETKANLNALTAGLYELVATIEAPAPAVGLRQPELRIRVFSADNSLSTLTVSAQGGDNFIRPTLSTYVKSDGVTPFKIAIDVIGAEPTNAGTVKVTSLEFVPVTTHSGH